MAVRKIIVCLDFSENSRHAGRMAREFAEAFDADIEVVHVVQALPRYSSAEVGGEAEIIEAFRRIEEAARQELLEISQEFQRPGREVLSHLGIGDPAEEIVRVADEGCADLIVMGTHGWTGIKHLLMGSVAEKVLRMAKCPVLVVRSNGGEE